MGDKGTRSQRILAALGLWAVIHLAASVAPAALPATAVSPVANGKIAYRNNGSGEYNIYAMNANGSGRTNLTNNPAFDVAPAWSPDGSKIAFHSNRDGDAEVHVMNADGSGVTNLTSNSSWDGHPAWSPDGSKIAFTSDRDGNNEVYVMNADGSGQTNLTNNPEQDSAPAFSPDGSKIAFPSRRDGNYEIYVMNADGSALMRLTVDPASDMAPHWQPGKPPPPGDSDGDGCTNTAELQADVGSEFSGGRRDPDNPWDYFNPTGDRRNRVDDILMVLNHYYLREGQPGYDDKYDRTFLGPNDWNVGPPSGQILVDDILHAVHQYFHDCGTGVVKPTPTPTPPP